MKHSLRVVVAIVLALVFLFSMSVVAFAGVHNGGAAHQQYGGSGSDNGDHGRVTGRSSVRQSPGEDEYGHGHHDD